MVGTTTTPSSYVEDQWKSYQKAVMMDLVKDNSIAPLVRALVDHTSPQWDP